MRKLIKNYGLNVNANYSGVVFAAPHLDFTGAGSLVDNSLTLAGEGTLTLSGEGELLLTGHGHLTLSLLPNTFFTVTSSILAEQSLDMVLTGSVGEYTRVIHHVDLALHATYSERLALKVSGHLDLFTQITHLAKSTSKLITKLVLTDGAKAIARGTIIIDAHAAGSVASERLDALLLGAKAEADLLPVLRVATDDVSCKHGATVGHIDHQALFYLQSRGLDDAGSKQTLSDAFLNS
ncbi:TPA: hypothetical protein DEP96_04225 [Candidatus Uhrbacteria bacterium]|nr:hypothetical protein [Candidatus Uhrbacteria bacterium]